MNKRESENTQNQNNSSLTAARMPARELIKAFALLLCIVNSVIVVVLLTRIDPFFNGNVFVLGDLQSYLNLSFILLALPVVSSVVALVVIFMKSDRVNQNIQVAPETEPQAVTASEELTPEIQLDEIEEEEVEPIPEIIEEPKETPILEMFPSPQLMNEKVEEALGIGAASFVCPQCGEVSEKLTVKLDFSSGTAKLEDVCPHCGYVFGETSFNEEN